MSTIHVPLSEGRAILDGIQDATPTQRRDAWSYLRRRGALDVAGLLGLPHVPAHLEDGDDGT